MHFQPVIYHYSSLTTSLVTWQSEKFQVILTLFKMCGFSIYLIAIVLGAVLEVNLVGSIALHKHLDHSRSNEVNLLNDKCSAFSGVLPDPKSGCCGHIEGNS